MDARVYVCTFVCMYMSMYVHEYVCTVCMCVYMYTYARVRTNICMHARVLCMCMHTIIEMK